MPSCIAKLGPNKYVIWSTIVDAPVTSVLNRRDIIKAAKSRWPDNMIEEVNASVARADAHGTSWRGVQESIERLIIANRAGVNEAYLTLPEIIKRYTEKP